MNTRRLSVAAGLTTVCLSPLILSCCSGPQPLSRAINPADETEYLAMIGDPNETPRRVFLQARAAKQELTIDEAEQQDLALSTTKNPFNARSDQDAVSRGAVIYKHECLMCHGENADGRGPAMPVAIPAMDFHRSGMRFAVTVHGGAPRSWFRTIHDGTSVEVEDNDGTSLTLDMPAYGERLAREQIWLVITYLQSVDADLPAEKNG
jgi:mono/diheme cytochrome c family protein